MLQQRLTRNLYTGQTEPLTAPLSFDFTEDLGDKRNLSLLSQYGGAAAAYSLRSLGSYNENVVRVRRASDNDEKDFTASQVSSGELTNWVNSQTVPPLDIGVETSEGRIPVPEGGTSIGTPAAAYSLRNLSTTYTGNVVDVRRSSDGVVASFTATEVADGTLTDWVGAGFDGFVSKWYDQSGNDNHAAQGTDASQPKIVDGGSLVSGGLDFDGVDDVLTVTDPMDNAQGLSLSLVANIADGQDISTIVRHGQDNPDNAWNFQIASDSQNPLGVVRCSNGTISTTTAEKYVTSGGAVDKLGAMTLYGVNLKDGIGREIIVNGTSLSLSKPYGSDQGATFNSTGLLSIGANADGTTAVNGTFAEIIIYDSDQSDNRTAIEANIGETYGITGIPAYDNTVDGFVETWYDQSSNGNDAEQTTMADQPKIVDGGVFLGQVDFLDGVGAFLETNNSDLANLSELSLFSVLEPVTASANEFAISAGSIVNSTGNYGGWTLWTNGYADRLDFATQARGSGTNSLAQANITSTSPVVYSATLNGTDAQASVNGVLGAENTSMITPYNSDTTRRKLRLGCQYAVAPTSFYRGAIKEAILYPSDQSANRVAIETNINDQYNIY